MQKVKHYFVLFALYGLIGVKAVSNSSPVMSFRLCSSLSTPFLKFSSMLAVLDMLIAKSGRLQL
jgi:hypothetical protein